MIPDLTDRLFRVGIAGCGAIAPLHVQALLALRQTELTGLADPDQAAAIRMQALWREGRPDTASREPGCHVDLETMLAQEKPDVVHICTPHHTHVPLAVQALANGCHVLLEKPPAITLDDLSALSLAAGRSDRTIGVCFQNRYNPASQQAKHLLQSGKIGPVRAARAFVTWKRDASYYAQAAWRGRWATEGGGVMINQAIHTLDLLIWLAGKPTNVEGTIANRHLRQVIEVEDTAEMQMTLENGATALFYATTAYGADAPVFLELDCADYRLRLEGDSLILLDSSGIPLLDTVLQSLLAQEPAHLTLTASCDTSELNGKACWGQGHLRLIRAFYESLQPDARTFTVDLASGSEALRALLALYTSDRTKAPVSLE
jgi:predicted dehydrogenase